MNNGKHQNQIKGRVHLERGQYTLKQMWKQLGIEETQNGEEWADGDKSCEGTEEKEEKYIIGEGKTQHRNYKNGKRKKKKKGPYTQTKLEEYY